MTDPTTNFIQRLKSLELTDNSKLAMRERLVSYLDMHPVVMAPSPTTGLSSFFAFASSRRFSLYAASFLVLIIAGGSVTLAAEGSAPGDALYDVKVHVNEPVMTALATGDTGQAQVAAKIATRRANEAVLLATRGTLTEARRADLTMRFTDSIKKAAEKADALAAAGRPDEALTVKENLAANLAGEAQALGAVATGEKDGDKARAEDLLAVVVASSDQITDASSDGAALVASLGAEGTDGPSSGDDMGTTTLAVGAEGTTTVALEKGLATTTPGTAARTKLRALFANRMEHRLLRITASTTLGNIRTTDQFGTLSLPSVQVDSALPQTSSSGSQGGAGGSEESGTGTLTQ